MSPPSKYMRAGSLDGFRDFVFELGSIPSEILSKAGIDETLWRTPDALISIHAYRRALNLAAEVTNTPRFGLMLSQRQSFEKLGPVGYLVKHAPTLRVSIDRLTRFIRTHDAGTLTQMTVDDGVVLWTHQLSGLSDESVIQQTDLAVGLGLKFIRTVVSEDWKPDTVMFEHQRPANQQAYERVFRCPILFEQSVTGVEFPESELDRPLHTADAGLYRILHTYLDQIDQEQEEDFLELLRGIILTMIESGKPTLERAGQALRMSRSQLQRRLTQEETTFQAVLEGVRYGLSRHYLSETELPLASIADILGFSEPAVFSRAFRRISGITPSEWRRKAKRRSIRR